MKGVVAYDCKGWHTQCPQGSVRPVFNGVSLWLWCDACRQLVNLESVSPKLQAFGDDPFSPGAARPPAAGVQELSPSLVQKLAEAIRELTNAANS